MVASRSHSKAFCAIRELEMKLVQESPAPPIFPLPLCSARRILSSEGALFWGHGWSIRNDPRVVRNSGSLLVRFSKIMPDGMVVFFPSYLYMESMISMWQGMVDLFGPSTTQAQTN